VRMMWMCSGVAWKYRPQHYAVDGLNTLRYKLVSSELRPLYTWLLVSLPPHPTYFKGSYRSTLSGSFRMYSSRKFYLLILMFICVITQFLQL